MPSILHKSSKFTNAGGIVLTGEDVQEDANGLVTASLNYTVDPAKAEKFNFSLDAQPPIYPRGYNTSRLQKGLLFMVDRAVSYENGFVHVQAKYAGALNVAQSSRFITKEIETLTISLSIQSGFVISQNLDSFDPVYDRYAISYRRRIVSFEQALLEGQSPPQLTTPDAASMIVSATYVSQSFAQPIQRTFFPPSSARDLLLSRPEVNLVNEQDTDFVTPKVMVFTASQYPEVTTPSS